MIVVRALDWPADRAALLALDTSFVTDQVYRLVQTEQSFVLTTVAVNPPVQKEYGLAHDVDMLPAFDEVLVAEQDRRIVGIAALKVESWNRRAVVEHFYIAPAARGRGVGRLLMERVLQAAQMYDVRCLWLETQTINYGAIQFYRQVGFQWCGLDTSLYDPEHNPREEIALFFARNLCESST